MSSSQNLETYLPIYDAVPPEWEQSRPFFVEQLKRISNSVNDKVNGLYIDDETLTGKQFISDNGVANDFRSVFRKTIPVQPLVAGANTFAHGINFDSNFTLVQLYVSVTDSVAFTAFTMVYDQVTMDATNININSPAAFDRAYAVVEYLREI